MNKPEWVVLCSLLSASVGLMVACGGTGSPSRDPQGQPRPVAPVANPAPDADPMAKAQAEWEAGQERERRARADAKKREEDRVEAAARRRDAIIVAGEANPITVRKYNAVKAGMSYKEAVQILGSSGRELSSATLGGITTVLIGWANRNGSNMNATFQDGLLVSKAQFGLDSNRAGDEYEALLERERGSKGQ